MILLTLQNVNKSFVMASAIRTVGDRLFGVQNADTRTFVSMTAFIMLKDSLCFRLFFCFGERRRCIR